MIGSRRPRHGGKPLPGAVLLALALNTATAVAACPPGAADGSQIRQGGLTLAWRPAAAGGAAASGRIPMARHFALEVQLCDKDGASAARLLKADATMPAHRHGMNYRPVVKPLGEGRFRVDGMMFHMAGQWELAFEVKAGGDVLRLIQEVQAD